MTRLHGTFELRHGILFLSPCAVRSAHHAMTLASSSRPFSEATASIPEEQSLIIVVLKVEAHGLNGALVNAGAERADGDVVTVAWT